MDFISSVSSFFKRPVLLVKNENAEETFDDFSNEAELGEDEEILAEDEPEIEEDNGLISPKAPFSEAASRFFGRINHVLPSTIAYYLKKAQGTKEDSLTKKLEPELKIWLSKLKDPSATHLEAQLKEFVDEFLHQELPVTPTLRSQAAQEERPQPTIEVPSILNAF